LISITPQTFPQVGRSAFYGVILSVFLALAGSCLDYFEQTPSGNLSEVSGTVRLFTVKGDERIYVLYGSHVAKCWRPFCKNSRLSLHAGETVSAKVDKRDVIFELSARGYTYFGVQDYLDFQQSSLRNIEILGPLCILLTAFALLRKRRAA
jgi:hypothetical protein